MGRSFPPGGGGATAAGSGRDVAPGPGGAGPFTPVETGLYAILVLAWGLNYLFVRNGLAFAPAIWLAAGRTLLGAIGFGVFLLARPSRQGHLDAAGIRDAVLLGLPNSAIFFGLWFSAAGAIYPGTASVLVYTFPLWVALLAVPVLGERLTGPAVGAIALGFAGVVLVSEPWRAGAELPLVPSLELLGAALSWAIGTVLVRRRFRGPELEEANFYQLAGGSAALLLAAVVLVPSPPPTSPGLLVDLVWLGLVGTSLGYGIWFLLLSRVPTSTLSGLTFLVPVVALTASIALLGERLDVVQAAGVGAVLVSLVATARFRARPSLDLERAP